MTDATQTPDLIAAAFLALADELTDIQVREDRVTGEVEEFNSMAFVQKSVLGGLCQSIHRALELSHENLVKAGWRLQRALKTYDGTELSKKDLDGKQAWAERLQTQVFALTAMAAKAEACYARHVGEAWVPFAKRTGSVAPANVPAGGEDAAKLVAQIMAGRKVA